MVVKYIQDYCWCRTSSFEMVFFSSLNFWVIVLFIYNLIDCTIENITYSKIICSNFAVAISDTVIAMFDEIEKEDLSLSLTQCMPYILYSDLSIVIFPIVTIIIVVSQVYFIIRYLLQILNNSPKLFSINKTLIKFTTFFV